MDIVVEEFDLDESYGDKKLMPPMVGNATEQPPAEGGVETFDLGDYVPDVMKGIGVPTELYQQQTTKEFPAIQPDTETGLQDAGLRFKVKGLADVPSEQDMMLEPIFGKEGFYRDEAGRIMIDPGALEKAGLEFREGEKRGTPLQLDADMFSGGLSEFGMDLAELGGDVTEIAIPMATFLVTKGSGAMAGVIRSILTTALTTSGKFLQEQIEEWAGLNNQEFGEVALDALETGAYAGGAEAGVSLGTPVARKILGTRTTRTKAPIGQKGQLQSTVPQERLDMIDRVRKNLEAEPSIGRQVGGEGMNISGGQQQLAENALLKTARQQAVNRAVRAKSDELIEGVRPNVPEASPKTFNVDLTKNIGTTIEHQRKNIKFYTDKLDDNLRVVESQLDQTGGASQSLGQEFKEVLGQSYNKFQDDASALYATVDNYTTPVVPTKALREARDEIFAKIKIRESVGDEIAETLPKTLHEDTTKLLDLIEQVAPSSGKTPEQTFQAMQSIRSQLRKTAFGDDVIKDIGQRNASLLDEAVTKSMESARKGLSGKALKSLQMADQFYAKNISKFDEVLFKRLTKNIRATGSIPPETAPMVQALINSNSYSRVKNILNLVKAKNPEMIKEIRKADMDLILQESTFPTGGYDPLKLQAQIKKRMQNKKGNTFHLVHGDDANSIRKMVDQLVAKDARIGRIDVTDPTKFIGNEGVERLSGLAEQVPEGNIKTILQDALKAVQKRDELYKDNNLLFKHLQEGGDNAYNASEFLLSQKNPNFVRQVKNFLGKESDEFKQLQQIGMRRLTSKLTTIKDDPLEILMEGAKLRKELLDNAPKYKELFGADKFKGMLMFAEEAQFASTSGSFGSIVSASIRARPLHNAGKIIKLMVVDLMLQKLSASNYFTRGILTGKKGRKFRKFSETASRFFANSVISLMDESVSDAKEIFENQDLIGEGNNSDQEIQQKELQLEDYR